MDGKLGGFNMPRYSMRSGIVFLSLMVKILQPAEFVHDLASKLASSGDLSETLLMIRFEKKSATSMVRLYIRPEIDLFSLTASQANIRIKWLHILYSVG
jgi:hypothetical protein